MGKFAEFCKGKTMGAFFLLLLSTGTALPLLAEDQAGVENLESPIEDILKIGAVR